MKIYSVPARYTPEINAAISALMQHIKFDISMRELGGHTYVNVDESRTGSILITVAEQPPRGVKPAVDLVDAAAG